MRLWRNTDGVHEGKFLVVRRDGSIPEWPHFTLGARDPVAPVALRAYAIEARRQNLDPQYVQDIFDMATEFEEYRIEHGDGDPDASPHRIDDPATIALMRQGKGA